MTDNYVTLVFHHLGYFEKQPVLHYVRGKEDLWDYINIDKLYIPILNELTRKPNYLK